jgi:hypothetical protein
MSYYAPNSEALDRIKLKREREELGEEDIPHQVS